MKTNKKERGRHSAKKRALISFAVVFILWEVLSRIFVGESIIIAPPSAIFRSFYRLLKSGDLQHHIFVSMSEFFWGYLLSIIIGIPFGMIMGVSKVVKDYADPWISALYATPIIALTPLLILLFGLGQPSKIAVVFIVGLFPLVINTYTGVISVDPNFIETAHAFKARQAQIFKKVLVPASLPFIIAGLRLALGRGLMGVVVGELFGARAGLGFLIVISAEVFDVAGIFVGVITLAVFGVVGTELLKYLETKLAPWRKYARVE